MAAARRAAALCGHTQARAPGVLMAAPFSGPSLLRPRAAARAAAAEAAGEEGPLVRLELGRGAVATMTLCRPKKLNSLSLPMIHELKRRYAELGPAGVRCVLLRGEGRALCAGGDVAEVREGILQGTRLPAEFFYHEYDLDYRIATMLERVKIVQVAFWDGIVMGGGVGLSIHSPIRIATERTTFAMPETLIGFFPDVGMTWQLSRLQAGEHVGIFLGLTGQRLGAADCLAAGLATHFCPSARLPELEARLRDLAPAQAADAATVAAAVTAACGDARPDASKAVLAANAEVIRRCFGGDGSADDIAARLAAEGGGFAAEASAALRLRSPTSVKVTLEAIRRHRSASLKDAFAAEYRMSQWCMRPQPQSDFCEGIRAVLVEKDHKPRWDPARFEEVSGERVAGFFAPLVAGHPCGELRL